MFKLNLSLVLVVCAFCAYGQHSSMKSLSLDDMSAFKPQSGNWQIVGDVMMHPDIDYHASTDTKQEPAPKKKRKSKTVQPPPSKPVRFTEGKGVLLNMNDEGKKDNLLTNWEHGDIDVEFDVMLPKGSNSGFYLQGRYEVQLYDSWGVQNPKFSDMGGIYRNWESEKGMIYMGKAPLSNPCKAPGLWQHVQISFKAPKFNESGKKIANARLVHVILNGIKIHDNVEIPLPTGGPVENNESPSGPIMIQGDHGAVAFRNIRYRVMRDASFSIGPVQYHVHHGNFNNISDFESRKPEVSGTSNVLSCEVVDVDNEYGTIYSGTVTVPETNTYRFTMAYTGGGALVVNDKELFSYATPMGERRDVGGIHLNAGTYPFKIFNYKTASWMPPRLALFVEADNINPTALHAFNSFPPDEDPVSSIFVSPDNSPRLLRAFLDFKGNRNERLTHTVGVGDPVGIHYVFDIRSNNVVCAWRGSFIDATPMWHDRGDGSFHPLGAVQYTFVGKPLAYLNDENYPFSIDLETFRSNGYSIEEATGRPVFKYMYGGLDVETKVYPDDNKPVLVTEVTVQGQETTNLFYKLAEGKVIEKISDDTYAINDKEYYIRIEMNSKASVRDVDGKKELIIPFQGNTLKYSMIW